MQTCCLLIVYKYNNSHQENANVLASYYQQLTDRISTSYKQTLYAFAGAGKHSVSLCIHYECDELICSPTIESINVVRKNIRQKVTGSRNINIPRRTVPAAPIPAHTA